MKVCKALFAVLLIAIAFFSLNAEAKLISDSEGCALFKAVAKPDNIPANQSYDDGLFYWGPAKDDSGESYIKWSVEGLLCIGYYNGTVCACRMKKNIVDVKALWPHFAITPKTKNGTSTKEIGDFCFIKTKTGKGQYEYELEYCHKLNAPPHGIDQ